MKKVINALDVRNKKILLVCKKGVWILPGGKPLSELETDEQCLVRECGKELPKTKLTIGEKYGSFTGLTPHSKTVKIATVYFATLTGRITPAREISNAKRFSRAGVEKLDVSEITMKIIQSLIQDGRF